MSLGVGVWVDVVVRVVRVEVVVEMVLEKFWQGLIQNKFSVIMCKSSLVLWVQNKILYAYPCGLDSNALRTLDWSIDITHVI